MANNKIGKWSDRYDGNFQGNVLLMKLTPKLINDITKTLKIDSIKCMTNKDNISITEKTQTKFYDGTLGYLPLGFLAAKQFVEKLYHDRVKQGLPPIDVFTYFNILCESPPPLYPITSKIEFKKTLQPDQIILMKKFVNALDILNAIKAPHIITIKASTGIGKTFLALNIINFYKLKAIIIVPRRSVISNWIKELNEAGISSVGSLQGSKAFMKNNSLEENYNFDENEEEDDDYIPDFNIENAKKFDKDVIIVVKQHFNNLAFKKFLMTRFSILIIDECHMSNVFKNKTAMSSLIYPTFPCTISMSATPKSRYEYVYGYMIEHENNNRFEKYLVSVPNLIFEHIKIPERQLNRFELGSDKYGQKKRMEIEKDITRNLTIYYTACNLVNSKTLIFCKYRTQMTLFYELLLKSRLFENVILADARAGNLMWEKILKQTENLTKYIIVGTIDHLGTGVNIPSLDNLLIAFSKQSNAEINQALGRLERGTDDQIKYAFIFPETTNKYYGSILKDGIKRIEQVSGVKNYNCIPYSEYLEKNNKTDLYKDIHTYSTNLYNIPDAYNVSFLLNEINIYYRAKELRNHSNYSNVVQKSNLEIDTHY